MNNFLTFSKYLNLIKGKGEKFKKNKKIKMFSRKKSLRKDLLPLSTNEKNQYAKVYKEFLTHITGNDPELTTTFYLYKDTPFDMKSWTKFLKKVDLTFEDKVFNLGGLGRFSFEFMGDDKYLLFEPKIRRGGKRKSKRGKRKQQRRKRRTSRKRR